MRYIDIHSHLNLPEFKDDIETVVAAMHAHDVATIIVGVDQETSESAVAIAQTSSNLFACIGHHPTDNNTELFDIDFYRTLASNQKVVAIGECGLDYFRLKGDMAEEKKRQKEIFIKQIELALELDLPLMIHARPTKGTMDAYQDVIDVLKAHKKANPKLRGNVHFFVGDISIAKEFLALGFTMSFTGVLTFSSDYDETVRFLPMESILCETDAPFVAPVPYRGKRCEPPYVREVVSRIAELKDLPLESVREALLANAKRVFALQLS